MGAARPLRPRHLRDARRHFTDEGNLAARKFALVSLLLRLRARWADLFLAGDYLPVAVHGGRPESLVAFARTHAGRAVLTVARRRAASPDDPSASLRIPAEATTTCIDLISGVRLDTDDGTLDLAAIPGNWPVALLWSGLPR